MERFYQLFKTLWDKYPHSCETCGEPTVAISSHEAMRVSSIGTGHPPLPPWGFKDFKFLKCAEGHLTRLQAPLSILRWACMPHWTSNLEDD
jgi:hypothetical protein